MSRLPLPLRSSAHAIRAPMSVATITGYCWSPAAVQIGTPSGVHCGTPFALTRCA
jgi:hypothetical protein